MGEGNLERILGTLFSDFGVGAYGLLFLALLLQTANPIGAALPGNPLVFVLGLLGRSTPGVSPVALFLVLAVGAFLGNLIGYLTGRGIGPRILASPRMRPFESRSQSFFSQHGSRAVFLAFFLPFVRCFLPILAGASGMVWQTFLAYSLAGSLAWVGLLGTMGYLFGEIPVVRQNLEWVVLAIGVYVALRIAIGIVRSRAQSEPAR